MKKFYIPVDLRSRAEMTGFLEHHFRYPTMNSWNRSTSYACNLKITRLELDGDLEDKLYEMLGIQEFFYELNSLLYEFGSQHQFRWQAGMNGRSGGYLVLYQGELKRSGYESYCTVCGQKNYRKASESDNCCGVCGNKSRVNFTSPHTEIVTYPGRGTDDDADFEEWSIEELRDRVRLVQDLDKLADRMVAHAVQMCKDYDIQEETIYVPQKRKVLVESA